MLISISCLTQFIPATEYQSQNHNLKKHETYRLDGKISTESFGTAVTEIKKILKKLKN